MRPTTRIAAAIIPAVTLLMSGDVRSEPVTFRFEGKVKQVAIDIPDFEGTLSLDWPDIGTSISGFYTFD